MAQKAIENAQGVIEAFGGIRPMAKKMGVAVTTVQGWKKRNAIPGKRLDEILNAAREHDVDLDDVLDGDLVEVANENVSATVSKDVQAGEAEEDLGDADEAQVSQVSESAPIVLNDIHDAPDVIDDPVEDDAIGEDGRTTVEAVVPELRALHAKIDHLEKQPEANNSATVISVIALLTVLGALAAGAFFWQQSEAQKAEAIRAEAERVRLLEEKLNAVDSDVQGVKESQGFLGQIIPQDLGAQIDELKTQAQDLKEQANTLKEDVKSATDQAKAAAQGVSEDVLAKDAGNLEQRLTKLETHLQDLTGSPVLAGLLGRFDALQSNPEGQDVLARSVTELDALFEALKQSETLGQSEEAINQTLAEARNQSDALGQSFEAVPQDDLKAAALLLGMAQLRSSLNRDNAAFESDVALLQKLVGQDNPALNDALNRLAPHAQEGVLTPSGLSSELWTFAGDAVAASLSGEDVSVKEQAKARMNELFQVEKDGELVTGTDTQASLVKAERLLEQGNIEGAIASVQALDGDALSAMLPWLEKAQTSLDAQGAKRLVNDLLTTATAGAGGKLIHNEETGINNFVPNGVPQVPGAVQAPNLPSIQ